MGPVIIVENAVRHLGSSYGKGRSLTSDERTEVVRKATLEVRSASVFGEAIIAIVYLPILALTASRESCSGRWRSLFSSRSGAFVLSLTLIPVLTSYVVRPRVGEHETCS